MSCGSISDSRSCSYSIGELKSSHKSAAGVESAPDASPSWKHLFVFTKREHARFIVSAIVATLIVGAGKTVYAIILGSIFNVVANFGAGAIKGQETLTDVSFWCMIFVVLGLVFWLANAVFIGLWIMFGELNANIARNTLFMALLKKEMVWFDTLEEGTTSSMAKIQK